MNHFGFTALKGALTRRSAGVERRNLITGLIQSREEAADLNSSAVVRPRITPTLTFTSAPLTLLLWSAQLEKDAS